MQLKIVLLLLSTLFIIIDGLTDFDPVFHDAEQFQMGFDKMVRDGDRERMHIWFTKRFYYLGCDGKRYGSEKYTDLAFAAPVPRQILSARRDKNFIIYKTTVLGKQQEIMIRKKNGAWAMERAQGLIC